MHVEIKIDDTIFYVKKPSWLKGNKKPELTTCPYERFWFRSKAGAEHEVKKIVSSCITK